MLQPIVQCMAQVMSPIAQGLLFITEGKSQEAAIMKLRESLLPNSHLAAALQQMLHQAIETVTVALLGPKLYSKSTLRGFAENFRQEILCPFLLEKRLSEETSVTDCLRTLSALRASKFCTVAPGDLGLLAQELAEYVTLEIKELTERETASRLAFAKFLEKAVAAPAILVELSKKYNLVGIAATLYLESALAEESTLFRAYLFMSPNSLQRQLATVRQKLDKFKTTETSETKANLIKQEKSFKAIQEQYTKGLERASKEFFTLSLASTAISERYFAVIAAHIEELSSICKPVVQELLQTQQQPGKTARESMADFPTLAGAEVFKAVALAGKEKPAESESSEDITTECFPKQPNQLQDTMRKIPLTADSGLTILPGLKRQKMGSCKLSWNGPKRSYHAFCVANTYVSFGRAEDDPSRNLKNDFIVRLLPCKSKKENPENWQITSLISRVHFALQVDPSGKVFIKDLDSTQGTLVNGDRVGTRVWQELPKNEAMIHIAEGAMEIDLTILRPTGNAEAIELEAGGPKRPVESPTLGIEHPGTIDAVRLLRVSNCPEHLYLVLLRQAWLGASLQNAILIPLQGVAPVHARIIYYRGEFFLTSALPETSVLVAGQRLTPQQFAPLSPGLSFMLGPVEVRVAPIGSDDYKNV